MTEVLEDWKEISLGDILTYLDERVILEDEKEYLTITVKRRHGGLEIRDKLLGCQIVTKKQYKLVPGSFIISRVQCWHQAFAIVGDVSPNTIASINYDQFSISPEVDPRFFWWLSHSPEFTETVRSSASGVVIEKMVFDRNAWLTKTVRLPSLKEQRRIVARIDELAPQIDVARRLRQQTIEEAEALMFSEEMKIWPREILSDAATLDEVTTYLARGRQSEQGDSTLFLIKSQHVQMGRYVNTPLKLAAHVAKKVKPEAIAKPNDILIACSAAGCLGRVAFYDDCQKKAATDTHVAIARANQERILPEYLYAYLKGAQGQVQLRSREKGDWKREKITFRLTELNVADMRKVPVPTPSLDEQRRILAELQTLQFGMDKLKQLQAETSKELDALLPSILDRAFKGEL